MLRAPLWLIMLLILVIVGLGVYGYFTTPLPLGLSSVIRTPGGAALAPQPTTTSGTPTPAQAGAGQSLSLGAASVAVQSVLRNQDLSDSGRGPVGSFTVVQIELQNSGREPLTPQLSDFRLLDDQGRSYAVDLDATRSVNTTSRHRLIFEASVPPAGRVDTQLAFETAVDATAFRLRVSLGYGEVELPR